MYLSRNVRAPFGDKRNQGVDHSVSWKGVKLFPGTARLYVIILPPRQLGNDSRDDATEFRRRMG